MTAEDCEWQYFRSGGKGGQNQNKRDTGCRVIHHPSGARGESREERSQLQNRKAAWRRMAESPKFKIWIQRQLSADPVDRLLNHEIREEDVKVEVKENGAWRELR